MCTQRRLRDVPALRSSVLLESKRNADVDLGGGGQILTKALPPGTECAYQKMLNLSAYNSPGVI